MSVERTCPGRLQAAGVAAQGCAYSAAPTAFHKHDSAGSDQIAGWLHREAAFVRDRWARAEGVSGFAALPDGRQAGGAGRGLQSHTD